MLELYVIKIQSQASERFSKSLKSCSSSGDLFAYVHTLMFIITIGIYSQLKKSCY